MSETLYEYYVRGYSGSWFRCSRDAWQFLKALQSLMPRRMEGVTLALRCVDAPTQHAT